MDGTLLKTLVNHMAASGGWPVSKGLRYTIVQSKAQDIRINGKAIDESVTYRVAMPDYVANGGSNAAFLRAVVQESTGRFMRDALIEYIQDQKQPISVKIEGRIEILN